VCIIRQGFHNCHSSRISDWVEADVASIQFSVQRKIRRKTLTSKYKSVYNIYLYKPSELYEWSNMYYNKNMENENNWNKKKKKDKENEKNKNTIERSVI
jgi:hypothetical protein